MLCPSCQQENAQTSSFCIHCGTELRDVDAEDEGQALDATVGLSAISELRRDVRQL